VRGRHRVSLAIVLLVAMYTAGVAPVPVTVFDWSSGTVNAQAGEAGVTRAVHAVTSTGRRGAYYLPRDPESRALPLLVFFHVQAPAQAEHPDRLNVNARIGAT
jgi:hypothetical protein